MTKDAKVEGPRNSNLTISTSNEELRHMIREFLDNHGVDYKYEEDAIEELNKMVDEQFDKISSVCSRFS